MMSRHQPELLVLCPAVRENVGEFQRHQLGTQPPDGRHVEEFEVFQAEVRELGSDDVEERQDGLHQADGPGVPEDHKPGETEGQSVWPPLSCEASGVQWSPVESSGVQ